MPDLADYLQKLHSSNEYPLHMPGHKRTPFLPEFASAYAMDITEIEGSDNLYEAEGILKDAMERAAKVYGAHETMFLVNGSTVGLLSAITGMTNKGDTILMARNCHKAVYHAVELRELCTKYVYPKKWKDYDIAGQVTLEDIKGAVEETPEIRLVVLTSPTYEGIVSPIREIAAYLHEKNIPLLVDEAHGAHFPFSDKFPESAVAAGADVVIQSMHKTLPVFTQCALMHLSKEAPNRDKIKKYVSYYQTSSPSYLFMASMDAVIAKLEKHGEALWNDFFANRNAFMESVRKLRHIKVLDCAQTSDFIKMDPGKVVIYVKNTSIHGKDLQNRLLKAYNIQLEMACAHYVLAIFTLCDSKEGWQRLADALLEVDATLENVQEDVFTQEIHPPVQMTVAEAAACEWEAVELEKATNRISAGYMNLYPPGIPMIAPGELFTKELIEEINHCKAINLHVQGFEEGLVRVLK